MARPATDLSFDPDGAADPAAKDAATRRTESAAGWRFLRGEETGEAIAAKLWAADFAAARGDETVWRVAG